MVFMYKKKLNSKWGTIVRLDFHLFMLLNEYSRFMIDLHVNV